MKGLHQIKIIITITIYIHIFNLNILSISNDLRNDVLRKCFVHQQHDDIDIETNQKPQSKAIRTMT